MGIPSEGFCELVAYKLMVLRGEEREQKVIQANLYSRGQIDALLQAEADYDFYRAVKWMKDGFDDKIARTNTSRLLVLRNSTPALRPGRMSQLCQRSFSFGASPGMQNAASR